MSFQCTVVTPEQQTLDTPATQAIVPAHDGLIGILTGRAPLLVKLGLGALRVDGTDGQTREFFIDGGVAQMKDNRLTILTTEATPVDELNAEAARAALAEATARVASDPKTGEQREHDMARAREQQRLARH